MDAQEFAVGSWARGGLLGLLFERREEILEPFKGRGVFADPDEFHAAETGGWVRSVAHVVDVFEDSGPWGNSNTGTDQDGDFVVKDVFGWCSVWSVDADGGHFLSVLESNFVDCVGVLVVEFCLGVACSESVSESTSEISYLTDVDGDVGVKWAGGDGKWMPLLCGDGRDVKEEPLSRLVFHRWLRELDLHGIYGGLVSDCDMVKREITIWMANNFDNLGISSASNLTVQTFDQVETTSPQLPSPTLITNAMVPEILSGKWREWVASVTNETSGSVGVHAQ